MKAPSKSKLLFLFILFTPIMISAQDFPNESMPVTDADGNVYKTIYSEEGTWIIENLKTTHFNDGTPIPLIKDKTKWQETKSPGYGWFSDDPGYRKTYGPVYNWYAVNTRKLCPKGWHVATEAEWNELMDYAGTLEKSGDNASKLKETGTAHWKSPNTGATNSLFFTALPAQYITNSPFDVEPGTQTLWWTSTEDTSDQPPMNALIVGLSYDFHSKTGGTYNKESALPVRCKMDE